VTDVTDRPGEPGGLALAAPEDAHTRADWEREAAAVLRKARRLGEGDDDAAVWEKLASRTLDGITVSPLGTREQIEGLPVLDRPTRSDAWDNRPLLSVTDASAAHEEAITDLENGATSLWLRLTPQADLATLLNGVFLDLAPAILDCPEDPEAAARAFLAHAEDVDLHPGTNLGIPADLASADLATLAADAGVLGFVVDGTAVHDLGASDVAELAASLVAGVGYLRTLEAAGVSAERAAGLVEFRYAATDEQFPTIAKLRAARALWSRVLELSGVAEAARGQRQHVVTSRPMMSAYDPYVNMLRTTVAAFAAGVAGAEAVTVLPFDSPLGRPEAFGRRIARNTSSLLVAESHVARVADPAGGSYAVERLTHETAQAAWELFGRLEAGADLAPLIEATVTERERQIATRRRPLTGLTEFPDLAETRPERAADPLAADVRRYGAAFEALRDDPPRAHVLLATMGSVAAHTARATFASNLFAAGGVAVEVAGPTETPEDLVAAYTGQNVVCLAGPDGAYEAWGSEAAAALRDAGAEWVVIAGKPVDYADDSCAMGVDALDFLTRTREKLA
jgi:methylmalonyl-CoA mutase